MSSRSNDANVYRVLVDGSLSIERSRLNQIPTWNAIFVLNYKGQQLNVSENVVYFIYHFSQNWFGPYFALSLMFDSNTYSKHKKIIQEHDSITVTFEDKKTTPFKFTFTPAKQSEVVSQDSSSTNQSIGSMHLFVRVYYPKILFDIDTIPKVDRNMLYNASVSTMKLLLQQFNTVLLTSPFVEKETLDYSNVLIKSSTIREALVNIAHNLRYGKNITPEKSISIGNDIQKIYLQRTYQMMDENLYYPFRLSTNTTGTNLMLSFYLDDIKNEYEQCALLCSLTSRSIDYDMLSDPENYAVVSMMTEKIDYSCGEEINYIKKANKCLIESTFSHYNYAISISRPISKIIFLDEFGNLNNLVVNDNSEEVTVDKTSCNQFGMRQSHAKDILNKYLQCSKVVFTATKGLIPTSFFTSNNGFIIWSIIKNLIHVAAENKITQTPGIEEIKMPSQLCWFKLEGTPVNGNPALMRLDQTIGLSRPIYL